MRIADKVFSSVIQRQTQTKATKAKDEKLTVDGKEAQQSKEVKDGQDKKELAGAAKKALSFNKTVDNLIRDQIEAKSEQKSAELAKTRMEKLDMADQAKMLNELKSRESSLASVKQTNERLIPSKLSEFVG